MTAAAGVRARRPLRITPASRPAWWRAPFLGVADLWRGRHVLGHLVRVDCRRTGANTVLGNLWWVLNPLLQMGVFMVFMAVILNSREPDHALFLFSATLAYTWFTTSCLSGTSSLVGQERLMKQVLFPRLVVPVAAVLAQVPRFMFGLLTMAGFMILFFPHRISGALVFVPLIGLVQILVTLPIAVLLAAANVYYRDVANLARHAFHFMLYLVPALWAMDQVLPRVEASSPLVARLIELNPLTILLVAWRGSIYGGEAPDLRVLANVSVVAAAALVLSIAVFKRLEPNFAKAL